MKDRMSLKNILPPLAARASIRRSMLKYARRLFNTSPYFSLFLQTVYAIEKLHAGFIVQHRIGMNYSF